MWVFVAEPRVWEKMEVSARGCAQRWERERCLGLRQRKENPSMPTATTVLGFPQYEKMNACNDYGNAGQDACGCTQGVEREMGE